jgi:hypothetical protein
MLSISVFACFQPVCHLYQSRPYQRLNACVKPVKIMFTILAPRLTLTLTPLYLTRCWHKLVLPIPDMILRRHVVVCRVHGHLRTIRHFRRAHCRVALSAGHVLSQAWCSLELEGANEYRLIQGSLRCDAEEAGPG